MAMTRRQFIELTALMLASMASRAATGSAASPSAEQLVGNFRYIYADSARRADFLPFLQNVFHLYPEQELQALIHQAVTDLGQDQAVYQFLQQQLDEIRPLLADLRYALPALQKQKQKHIMAVQTQPLLPEKRFEGYLEIGSSGRYLDSLEERLDIQGQRVFISEQAPDYSLEDMLDRGQIAQAGEWLALNDYRPALEQLAEQSMDLITVYIGFHHCPVDLRESFIGTLRNKLKPGGQLILRDHDVHDQHIWHLVALAHDVFNMGTMESWQYNADERRHFYSLQELQHMMQAFGFKQQGQSLRQQGDPTLNTLMRYQRA
ncbi:class I SAM-dependent methyltransferase [Bowmanella sp. Y26]|uniref:class I SAM-dependent methyltransferase n=1 Tax=Bowmanella yangjiangensis TaxID=2811230 RepID=UPI001BDD01F3|nr:class I SAM-dependent methyltransferase [Bowmanella yangjiangensis]MBT1065465.1 class I SAM-dependent methyltransferase [Bowmanella yangjiangensis]